MQLVISITHELRSYIDKILIIVVAGIVGFGGYAVYQRWPNITWSALGIFIAGIVLARAFGQYNIRAYDAFGFTWWLWWVIKTLTYNQPQDLAMATLIGAAWIGIKIQSIFWTRYEKGWIYYNHPPILTVFNAIFVFSTWILFRFDQFAYIHITAIAGCGGFFTGLLIAIFLGEKYKETIVLMTNIALFFSWLIAFGVALALTSHDLIIATAWIGFGITVTSVMLDTEMSDPDS